MIAGYTPREYREYAKLARKIYANVFEWNPASRRVLEKAGYALEGRLRQSAVKDGHVLDGFLYAVVRERTERTQKTDRTERGG